MARIMIADDSDAIRLVLKDILEIGNHEVACEAVDGLDAINRFSETRPDALLLDLSMPKIDGLSVVKEILSKHPDAKIILITANDNQNIINQCLGAGATAFVSKPFDFDNVLKIISNAIKTN